MAIPKKKKTRLDMHQRSKVNRHIYKYIYALTELSNFGRFLRPSWRMLSMLISELAKSLRPFLEGL